MFGIGPTELLVILAVALVILGPKKLPEVAKGLGRALGELRRASQDLRDTIELESRDPKPRDSGALAKRPAPPGAVGTDAAGAKDVGADVRPPASEPAPATPPSTEPTDGGEPGPEPRG